MKKVFVTIWVILAVSAVVSAMFINAPWHYGTGAMSAAMAWVIYRED